MTQRAKPVRAWAVVTSRGRIVLVRMRRNQLGAFLDQGCSVEAVEIREVPKPKRRKAKRKTNG